MNTIKIIALTMMMNTVIMGCSQRKDYLITIHTDKGTMVAILYDETPKHKENFLKLIDEGFYDSLLFHRVIKDFMIQGGDPNSRKAQAGQSLGDGGPGYTIEEEINEKFFHEKGALSAARMGDQQNPKKASSGSQFYIVQGQILPQESLDELKIDQKNLSKGMREMLAEERNKALSDSLNELYFSGNVEAYKEKIYSLIPQLEKEQGLQIRRVVSEEKIKAYTEVGGVPHLDNEYTVFGKIIDGLDVIDKIAEVQTGPSDRPVEDIHFRISAKKMSRKKITERYGYEYP